MILHTVLPEDQRQPTGLPGMKPVHGPWFRVDEAYAGQMALRRHLLSTRREDVLATTEAGQTAACELYGYLLGLLPEHGFEIHGQEVLCPDGVRVALNPSDPLGTLGALVQCDLCLMEKAPKDDEHHLSAAVLCFPAAWTLQEKIGKPLVRIHKPVAEYAPDLAKRVQRLFDGVQVGRPLWRFNYHAEERGDLFTPMREAEKGGRQRPPRSPEAGFIRSERQTVLRLPQTRAVLFAIHTYILRRGDVEQGWPRE